MASGLAMLFAGGDPVAVRAAGGLEVSERALGVDRRRRASAPPSSGRWRPGRSPSPTRTATAGFELRYEARSAPAEIASETPAAKLGGMQGYEQLCRVTGTVRTPDGESRVDCLGQRGHSWGAPDWDRIELARTARRLARRGPRRRP